MIINIFIEYFLISIIIIFFLKKYNIFFFKFILNYKLCFNKFFTEILEKNILHRKYLHLTKLAHDRNLHLCRLCTVQICDFCIWKNICAADLRILCTTVFRTFADLHICVLHICICTFVHEIVFEKL